MFQEYNKSTIVSKFIKELLYSTNVPTVQIWKPGRALIKGFTYVTKEYIVTAERDFMPLKFLTKVRSVDLLPEPTIELKNARVYCIVEDDGNLTYYKVSGSLMTALIWSVCDYATEIQGPQHVNDIKYFKVVCPYVEGKRYFGITSNFESNSSMYDSDTHEHLGNYLRMLRDLHDIDLMSYYNCWSGAYTDSIRLNFTKKLDNDTNDIISSFELLSHLDAKEDGKKVLIVPIKFNKEYTIFINSNVPVQLVAIYYDGLNPVKVKKVINCYEPTDILTCSYASPYIFKGIWLDGASVQTGGADGDINNILLEEYLTLLIQVPKSNKSPIVVLEGNYSNINLLNINKYTNKLKTTYFGECPIGKTIDYSNYYISYPSLLRAVNGKTFAFSDRLLEYLLLNVIHGADDISKNIERVQNYVSTYKSKKLNGASYDKPFIKGVWSNDLRKYIYDLVTQIYNKPLSFDVNGYVDKDTEEIILRGKS